MIDYRLKTRARLRQNHKDDDQDSFRPKCTSCETTDSPMWHRGANEDIVCNACFTATDVESSRCSSPVDELKIPVQTSESQESVKSTKEYIPNRKSCRLKHSKKSKTISKLLPTKGKSRRVIFKRQGQCYQLGDVVSVEDEEGGIYYAQLTGFLQDQYMEKSVTITWLIPTTGSPSTGFDPATFILGQSEEFPRNIDLFEFVCHAPSDYFRRMDAPYPTAHALPKMAYISTSIGPEVRPLPSRDHIFFGDLDRASYTPPARPRLALHDPKKDKPRVDLKKRPVGLVGRPDLKNGFKEKLKNKKK